MSARGWSTIGLGASLPRWIAWAAPPLLIPLAAMAWIALRWDAIFVQKRIGCGYTVNMGNRLAWLIMGGFLAAVAGLVFTFPR